MRYPAASWTIGIELSTSPMTAEQPNRNDPCPCGSGRKYKKCCKERDDELAAKRSAQKASTASDYQVALSHLQAGRLIEAESICKRILEVEPNKPEVLHMLGVIAYQAGMFDVAVDLIRGSLQFAPTVAEAHYNLGNAFREQGLLAEAAASYRQAVALKPDYAIAHGNLAGILHSQGKLSESAESDRLASSLMPNSPELHYNLASTLLEQGQPELAAASYQTAIALKPDYAEAHCNLGAAFADQRRWFDAAESYRRAIALRPGYAAAYCNLGAALVKLAKVPEAVAAYRESIRLQPNLAKAHHSLALVLREQGNSTDAIASAKAAMSIDPTMTEAYNTLGELYRAQGQLDEATEVLQQALRLNRDFAEAYGSLGLVFMDRGQLDLAADNLREALRLKPDYPSAYSNLLLLSQYMNDVSPAALFAEHLRYAERFEGPLKANWPKHANPRVADRRLRIGYVSGDFRDHSVAFFIEPILANHDKLQVEVYCYHNYAGRDWQTDAIAAHADRWVDCVGMSDQGLAERVLADGIDILVDLSGHTAYNRLLVFARKPAPIQVTWIGAAGTTGLSAMDYRISDRNLTPPGLFEAYHSERLVLLPDTGAAYRPNPDGPSLNPLPALTSGRVVLACLNNLVKINRRVLNLWARLLAALPDARLMLGNVKTPGIRRDLLDRLAESGIDQDRVILQPRLPTRDYLVLHHQIDLALDPFPYGGGTTTMHSLWMGVPVLTLVGDQVVSRCGAAALASIGLQEFITHSEDEYLARAISICSDLPALNELRQSLRSRMSHTSCDAASVTRQLEAAFRKMWGDWCATPR
jgi:protein O-GlcNAc transferase